MKRLILIFSLILIGGCVIWAIPVIKEYNYKKEVESLAFSYRIYKSSVCPNKTILKGIRDDYFSTIKSENVSKLIWMNNNFDIQFMNTCLQMNPHRGEY